MNINDQLNQNIPDSAVKRRDFDGMDYVEGWWVIDQLNQIFGYDNWSHEIISLDEVWSGPVKNNLGVVYKCICCITADGATRFGAATGRGISKNPSDAYDTAIKAAETDALKRAAIKFGRYLGLALYDKDKLYVGGGGEAPLERTPSNAPQWTINFKNLVDFATQMETKLTEAPTQGFLARVWSDNSDALKALAKEDDAKYAALKALYDVQTKKLKGGLFKK